MADSLGLSKEHEMVYDRMKCPLCGQAPIVPKYFDQADKLIPFRTAYSKMDALAIAECPKCRQRWSVFSGAKAGIVRQRMSEITVKGDPSKISQLDIKNLDINELTVIETERVEEHLGSENRVIDNSKSGVTVTREFNITKEWSQSYVIDYEKTRALGGEINAGIGKNAAALLQLVSVSFKATFQKTIKDRYSTSEGTKLTYSEKITLQVKEKTKLRVTFEWKRLWQHGLLKISTKNGTEIEIPFRVAIGVTFDQVQLDE
jgi:hypothetical protein